MNKQKKTVRTVEDESGQADSIRNLDGSNARGDKKISTLQKQFAKLIPRFSLPDSMPKEVVIHYEDGSSKSFTGLPVQAIATVLHGLGLL